MITCKLQGGLGNQLFQIATTYSHAIDNGFDCGFDLRKTNIPLQGRSAENYACGLYYELKNITLADHPLKTYKEPKWEYTPLPPFDNLILDGYFQSPIYFDHNRKALLKLFLNENIRLGLLNRLEDRYSVELRNSVALHVRRGDYLKFPEIHPLLDMNYYFTAIEELSKQKAFDCILVFSDDIPWCKDRLGNHKMRYVEGNSDDEDMMLMSLCQDQIICNSSFSWWGAYFNENPDKIVIAPKKWFGDKVGHGWDSIYTKDMIVL